MIIHYLINHQFLFINLISCFYYPVAANQLNDLQQLLYKMILFKNIKTNLLNDMQIDQLISSYNCNQEEMNQTPKQPMRLLWQRIRRGFSVQKQRAKEVSMMMNQKIAIMKETLLKTTPRAFSILFILASVPAFYFINEMMEREYADAEFVNSSNRFYKYYYIYNLTFFGCAIALSRFNFHSPSSKYTIPKTKVKSAIFPFLFSFIGLMIPETDNKHLMWPALGTLAATMVIQGVMVNKGILPFWFYSYRHYIGLFYFIMFFINFTAMKRLQIRRKTHSHEFVDEFALEKTIV